MRGFSEGGHPKTPKGERHDVVIFSPEEAAKLRNLPAAKALKEELQKNSEPVPTPEQKAARQNETRLEQVIKKLDMQISSLYTQDRKKNRPLGERLMAFDLKKGQAQELGKKRDISPEKAQIQALKFRNDALKKGREAIKKGEPLPSGFLEALSSVLTERAEILQSAFADKGQNPKALELAQQNLEETSELFQWAEQKSPKG